VQLTDVDAEGFFSAFFSMLVWCAHDSTPII